MPDYRSLFDLLAQSPLSPLVEVLRGKLEQAFDPSTHGDLPCWLEVLNNLPYVKPTFVRMDSDVPTVGAQGDCLDSTRMIIDEQLRKLHPWRKGPYDIHGVYIDAEWRSDLKWNRLIGSIEPLQGKTVLDVGSGNGYHCWRMIGEGAKLAIGIDPTLISVIQFEAIKHFAGKWPIHLLPLSLEEMPKNMPEFHTVFSMGVLYHRRSPLDHLLELQSCLRPGGQLVLETIVIEGDETRALFPDERYARMRNVWFIPSCGMLGKWLKRCGFRDIQLIDVSITTTEEQRATDWMRFQSLADSLDPFNPAMTVEGLPSPRRAIFLAKAP